MRIRRLHSGVNSIAGNSEVEAEVEQNEQEVYYQLETVEDLRDEYLFLRLDHNGHYCLDDLDDRQKDELLQIELMQKVVDDAS